MAQKFFFQKLDLTLSIEARRILKIETHPLAVCQEQVFGPTQRLLRRIALQSPTVLQCGHGKIYVCPGFSGTAADIDIITLDNKMAYLATIISQDYAQSQLDFNLEAFQELLKFLQDLRRKRSLVTVEKFISAAQNMLKLLKERGKMSIVRDRVGCKIPVDSEKLDSISLTKGVRRYFEAFIPQLVKTPVLWLSEKRQQVLYAVIWEKAKGIANPPTKEEHRRMIARDII